MRRYLITLEDGQQSLAKVVHARSVRFPQMGEERGRAELDQPLCQPSDGDDQSQDDPVAVGRQRQQRSEDGEGLRLGLPLEHGRVEGGGEAGDDLLPLGDAAQNPGLLVQQEADEEFGRLKVKKKPF